MSSGVHWNSRCLRAERITGLGQERSLQVVTYRASHLL
jgi:hypothetical protein